LAYAEIKLRQLFIFHVNVHLFDGVEWTHAVIAARITERAPDAVPEGQVLAVVVVVEEVMVGVVGRAVDYRLQCERNAEVSVVNGHGPDVDEDVEEEIGELVQGKKERIEVIRDALKESINGMKRVTRKRSRYLLE